MTTFNDLLHQARNRGQLMAEDKRTGVKVVLKRSQFGKDGWRVECFIHGVRKSERTARAVQEGAL